MELPNDVLNIIIDMSCTKTKRILSMTSKYFKNNIELEMNYGKKNVEYLKFYLMNGSLKNKNNLILYSKNGNIEIIINDNNTKITFLKMGNKTDVPRSIGHYMIESHDFSLSKFIHKRQHKFVSELFMNLYDISFIYRFYFNDISLKIWSNFIKNHGNE
jgi:hypothetical protein